MYEKFQENLMFLASTHVRSLKLKGHLSGFCQNSHKRITQHETGETRLGQSPVKRILGKLGSNTVR